MATPPRKRERSASHGDVCSVYYYMSGDDVVQEDRDYVAQVMAFFAIRGKRDNCPPADAVVLEEDLQGVTNNRDAENPIEVNFRTFKHVNAMYKHMQDTRANHHNIVVHVKIDDSPYYFNVM